MLKIWLERNLASFCYIISLQNFLLCYSFSYLSHAVFDTNTSLIVFNFHFQCLNQLSVTQKWFKRLLFVIQIGPSSNLTERWKFKWTRTSKGKQWYHWRGAFCWRVAPLATNYLINSVVLRMKALFDRVMMLECFVF